MASEAKDDEWTVEYYVAGSGEQVGASWLDELDEAHFAAWVAFVEVLLVPFGKDIPYRNWVKALGDGLFELRIDQPERSLRSIFGSAEEVAATPKTPILLRAFCTFTGKRIVVVFGGYDKGADPAKKRQQREIKTARRALDAWRREQPKKN